MEEVVKMLMMGYVELGAWYRGGVAGGVCVLVLRMRRWR